MWAYIGFAVFVTIQIVVFAKMGILFNEVAISIMSIEALYFAVGGGLQATFSMRKADPKDEF